MATKLGTNDLKVFRRHATNCTRYEGQPKPDTFMPGSKKEAALDTCGCPIWVRGYLAKETDTVDGVTKPIRVRAALGCVDWSCATTEVAKLYQRGALPSIETVKAVDHSAVTVKYAAGRYLESRSGASLNKIEKDTYDHYASLLDQRFLPWCADNDIVSIREFENTDVCSQFTESWRQLRRNVGAVLEMSTRKTELARFRTFLKFCVTNDWMKKSGAKDVKFKKGKTAEETERFGLELAEYRQMLKASDSTGLTDLQNRETRVATELMRWSGLRISDAHKFNDSEIKRNESKHGWNASFIMMKTKQRCEVPLPDHVYDQLKALPGRIENGKKYFFTCEYSALRERVDTLAVRAQANDKPFLHPFSPHCLRHTFAIQHLTHGTDIGLVSKWLGHQSRAVTEAHYSNWITSTKKKAEDVSKEANARMLAQMEAIGD